ncbi:uncharacterized protein P174DRAFT_437329 [Aspergillus novofumigatus IBT 16806]|uniref:Uncharacterized protein n=1 Tax=Aspergillus novofumigatus (strain IBT 16806) TaxID=1392255 RepID=A0A2I1CMN4_ASPN1|nr:uncharacterized protein P174DRAFT_437329 [Aspergillus novofumigatus IBT 16806]PKX98891.1 hypothetical protein P174DRAFT_437329 [Aspergillus novofumigatus IBT 16806]
MATKDNLSQPSDEAPGIPSVAPDGLCIDGHLFRINYDVPEEITQQMWELYDRDAKYEEIPEHLKAYETDKEDTDVEEARLVEEYRRKKKSSKQKGTSKE